MCTIGPDEVAQGICTLRNMQTHEEKPVSLSENIALPDAL
ncbi:MAG: hypothetical protein LUB61_01230 [Eggerthellaceae bacterium]|nr:hypothetical protein [Eggerthellaceae bacterium]